MILAFLIAGGAAFAQDPSTVYVYDNDTSGSIPLVSGCTTAYSSTGGNVTFADNGYDGSQGSMTCKSISVASESGCNTIGGPVTISLPVEHQNIGHLTIKLFTPTDDFTLVSRPGTTEGADDGTGGAEGDDSNLSLSFPITFAMAAGTDAESMGSSIGITSVVCDDDGICSFNPNIGASGLSEDLADLIGDAKNGTWELCIADSVTGDGGAPAPYTGTLGDWTLNLGSITGGADDCTTSGLARTFTVPDSFTVSSVGLGLNVTHPDRGDVRAYLVAPGGSSLQFVAMDTSDNFANYDVMISSAQDDGEHALNDGSDDPVADPYYYRLPYLSTADFFTGNAAGTWTLYVCDGVANNVGTLNRARLALGRTAVTGAQVCTSTLTYQWEDNGNNAVFTSAAVGDTTLTLTSTADPTGDQNTTTDPTRVSMTTQTGTFGGEAGYYLQQMNLETSDWELALLRTSWSFTPAVRDLRWTLLDCDNGGDPLGTGEDDWEDYLRVLAPDASGGWMPFTMDHVNYSRFDEVGTDRGGDIIESDGTANVADGLTTGNVTLDYLRAVLSLTVDYTTGQDVVTVENPASQRIGNGAATWCAYDFGDAPSTYGTALANGAKHVLGNRLLWLGTLPPDGEADGAPNVAAAGDDIAAIGGNDDEDGYEALSFPGCTTGTTYSVDIRVNNFSGSTAYLVGYIDWDRDTTFDNDTSEESAAVSVPNNTTNGVVSVTWTGIPVNCGGETPTYARFRFTTAQVRAQLPTDGAGVYAVDGEVEDYELSGGTLPVTLASLAAAREGGRVRLDWTTASEVGNVGFNVYGRAPGGPWRRLNAELVPAQGGGLEAQSYTVWLEAPGGVTELYVEDVNLHGRGTGHRAFAVVGDAATPALGSPGLSAPPLTTDRVPPG